VCGRGCFYGSRSAEAATGSQDTAGVQAPMQESHRMANDRIPMTREGYEKKKAELNYLENVLMIEITKRVATAREMGDLSENAEYHAAREDQGMNQAKIIMLKDQLAHAEIIDPSTVHSNGVVVFGAKVKVKDLDGGDEEEFQLVGQGEEDYDLNKILITSPIGQGLVGKKKGDVAEIQVPKGTLRFKIIGIAMP
jgi:transcription elongation factor GreA